MLSNCDLVSNVSPLLIFCRYQMKCKSVSNVSPRYTNTNRLHTHFWPEEYPEVRAAADHIYLSQDLGMRKPEARIYQHVLQKEGFSAADAVFFDDNADNIEGANQLGITSILVKDKATIPDYFAKLLC